MKKSILAWRLSLTVILLCLVIAIPTYASELNLTPENLSGDTSVSLNVDRSQDHYTFIIPSTITVDPKTGKCRIAPVLSDGWSITAYSYLTVSFSSANHYYLIDGNGVKVPYHTKEDMGGTCYPDSTSSTNVFKMSVHYSGDGTLYNSLNQQQAAGALSATAWGADITINEDDMPKTAGTYTDTLTFTIQYQ